MKATPFVTALTIAIACLTQLSRVEAQLNLVNGGFETYESTTNWIPTSFGDWSTDYTLVVSGADSGILPRSGSGMLTFLGTTQTGASGDSSVCELWQLVSLAPLRTSLDAGLMVTVTGNCFFNRVAGDAQTDTLFELRIDAYDGSPTNFPGRLNGWLRRANAILDSDSNPATWEQLTTSLEVPSNATFLAVKIQADENVVNDSTVPEFDGHFADDITLSVQVEPPAPRLQIRRGGTNHLLLSWPTIASASYQVFSCSAIPGSAWTALGDPLPGTGNEVVTTDSVPPDEVQRYYRLVAIARGN